MADDRGAESTGQQGPSAFRSGRWLVVIVVMVVAMAILLPLAVSAMRDLVALSG